MIAPTFQENFSFWVSQPYFMAAVLIPFLMSLAICAQVSRFASAQQRWMFAGLVVISYLSSLITSFWDSTGSALHVMPWGFVLASLAVAKYDLAWPLAYPVTYFSVLGVDLTRAVNHPLYPDGVGGAGLMDGLLWMPAIGLVLAFMTFRLKQSGALKV